LILLTLIPSLLLILKFDVGYMNYYFMGCVLLLIFFILLLFSSSSKKHYVWLHNILKLIIIVGVFSILLIDIDLVLNRIL
jgi:4-hydroxybenzoate polyprenyltransferase